MSFANQVLLGAFKLSPFCYIRLADFPVYLFIMPSHSCACFFFFKVCIFVVAVVVSWSLAIIII